MLTTLQNVKKAGLSPSVKNNDSISYEDNDVFKDAYEEAQRIIRISDEVRITLDEIKTEVTPKESIAVDKEIDSNMDTENSKFTKLTTAKLGTKLGLKHLKLLKN